MDLMAEITCDEVLDLAYDWLCRRSEHTSHNNDVWDVRWRWADLKPRVRRQLLAGQYRLGPTRRVHCEQHALEIWSALDALVLKATAIVLGRQWHSRLSDRCFHLAGRGGAKAAVRAVLDQLRASGPRDSPSSLLIYSTGCYITRMWCQNGDASRYFASRAGLSSALGEVEKCQDGIFQRTASPRFVFRTDVKSYYASIDHDILLEQLRALIPDG